MGIRTTEREQKIYTLDPPDAIEAIVQYIEAKTAERIPRNPDLILNFNNDDKLVSLIVTYPASSPAVEEKAPGSGGKLH